MARTFKFLFFFQPIGCASQVSAHGPQRIYANFISSLAVGWLWMAYGPTAGFAIAFALMTVGSAFLWRIRYNKVLTRRWT